MNWQETLKEVFPKAISFENLEEKIRAELGQEGFNPDNTLFANCTCRDEINQLDVDKFSKYWGENFDLAGLAGFPSFGVTGLSACAHHVPDEGQLLILYGSHIGISAEGEWGAVKRMGMEKQTTSCGSLFVFLNKIQENADYEPTLDALDGEQFFVEKALLPYAQDILSSDNPAMAMTEVMLTVIESKLKKMLSKAAPGTLTTLVGGITINTPEGTDYFDLRSVTTGLGSI